METFSAAASTRAYRPRHPERTVLYRALAHHFERFLQVYEERFEPTFGYLRSVVARVVYRYLDCGLLEQGFARPSSATIAGSWESWRVAPGELFGSTWPLHSTEGTSSQAGSASSSRPGSCCDFTHISIS